MGSKIVTAAHCVFVMYMLCSESYMALMGLNELIYFIVVFYLAPNCVADNSYHKLAPCFIQLARV